MTQAELFVQLDTKPSWGRVEVKELITRFTKIIPDIKKYRQIEELRKYDVVYMETMALAHYVLIHRIKDGMAYGVLITSKQECHNLHQITKDRQFKGDFATKTYLCWPLETASTRFVRAYEDKREADLIFRKLKQFYKETLNI